MLKLARQKSEKTLINGENMASQYTALNVAQYILHIANHEGQSLDPLKLGKLVYYVQSWSLVFKGEPIFDDVIEAWTHGPVVSQVYQEYKKFGYKKISTLAIAYPNFGDEEALIIREVWDKYKHLSGRQLEKQTHNESPWQEARKRANVNHQDSSKEPILPKDMKAFYEKQFKELNMKNPLSPTATVRLKSGEDIEVGLDVLFDYLREHDELIQLMSA
ncbi:Panacea domain-containing protein [Pseudanabaena sp. UWO310]|uniref:Panacea domain-containing protein n=1 Tax=Pseudanabaena sp. UWO310 TaxID=2480795 RepID=UPI00115C1947|nr:type II toxin-antitoxin system antitoxin SocA domain-containing protein [Pseudanabaena sp. UWO310]TYQ29844.1 DUF4065 domain-containing protein [Pseudanabaena sp. UWO310]